MKASLSVAYTQHSATQRLWEEYQKYRKLVIAFDFDNTIFDYHNSGLDVKDTIDLLKRCSEEDFIMVLFTSNEDEKCLQWMKDYCLHFGIRVDYINESPIMNTRKPYYNILLDDRAGLQEAADTLNSVLNLIEINRDKLNQSDK